MNRVTQVLTVPVKQVAAMRGRSCTAILPSTARLAHTCVVPVRIGRNSRLCATRYARIQCFSTTAAPTAADAAKAPEAGSTANEGVSEGTKAEQGAENTEGVYEDVSVGDEPFVARLSRFVWNTIKFSVVLGIVSIIVYAGYTIVVTLLPSGTSANAIMRQASVILKNDTAINRDFGDIKTYGEDFDSTREGRRYFVPDYTYVDDLTDVKYHRVRFNLEGERGKKATVWAEARHGTYDFRYIIVLAKDRSRVWSIIDNRPPERTLEERQSSVTSLLQDSGWKYYVDNDVDISEQATHLGDYWLKVRTVRCDRMAEECEKLGVTSRPAWAIEKPRSFWKTLQGEQHGDVEVIKGVRNLKELEIMTKDLRKRQSGDESIIDKVKRIIGL